MTVPLVFNWYDGGGRLDRQTKEGLADNYRYDVVRQRGHAGRGMIGASGYLSVLLNAEMVHASVISL